MKNLLFLVVLILASSASAQTFTNGWNFRLNVSDQVQDSMKYLKRIMELKTPTLTNVSLKDFATNYVVVVVKPEVENAIRDRRNRLLSIIQTAGDDLLNKIETDVK